MALLKITAELLELKITEPFEEICEKIVKKHGIEELGEAEKWSDLIDPASMTYAVFDETLYLVSDLEVIDAEETYSVMEMSDDNTSIFMEAVIDDEDDLTLREVFDAGFETLTEGE
jgi:hypothetical protein